MFKFLKEKIGSWTKKISKETSKEEEPISEEETPKIEKPTREEVKKETKEKIKETAKKAGLKKPKEILKKDLKPEKEYELDLKPKEEPEKPKEEKKGFFSKLGEKISKVKITEEQFEIYSEELEMLLLENNVALEVAEKIVKELKEEIVGKELLKKEIEYEIKDDFKEIVRRILVEPFSLEEKIKSKEKKPYVVMFCGINGTGKTTTLAKIASSLKKKGISCVMVAADTFRAASIEQLRKHGEKTGIKVISHDYGSDPAAVGFDGIKYAEKNNIDCVLIDTAGRMHTAKNLMAQIEKVAKVTSPDTKIFVGESITGNDVIEQARSFDWAVHIDGIILTKADIDEKGGTALSVGYVTKKPILYLGTGQEYDEIEPFDKEKFIDKLGLNEEE